MRRGRVAGLCPWLNMQGERVVVEGKRGDGRTIAPFQIVGGPVRGIGFPEKITIVGNQSPFDLAQSTRLGLGGQLLQERVGGFVSPWKV